MGQHGRFKNCPSTFSMVGGAGVAAVATQLMLRNVIPFFPMMDRGVDLMAENGCRIQVKSCNKCVTYKALKKNSDGVYRFSFPSKKFRNTSTRGVSSLGKTKLVKPFHEVCDVVVLWGVDENRFWIVPALLLKGVGGVDLGPDNTRGFSKDVPEMRAMLAAGKSQSEVAEHFGISQAAVSIRLKREGTKIFLSKTSAAIRACENAWENILDFGSKQVKVISEEVNGEQLEQTANLAGYGQQLP